MWGGYSIDPESEENFQAEKVDVYGWWLVRRSQASVVEDSSPACEEISDAENPGIHATRNLLNTARPLWLLTDTSKLVQIQLRLRGARWKRKSCWGRSFAGKDKDSISSDIVYAWCTTDFRCTCDDPWLQRAYTDVFAIESLKMGITLSHNRSAKGVKICQCASILVVISNAV